MKNIIAVAILVLLVAGCDGGFSYSGTVVAGVGSLPETCRATLRHESDPEPWHDTTFRPPALEGKFTVAPSPGVYELELICPGFKPYRHSVEYGGAVSPDKPLELGKIVLVPGLGA